MQYFTHSLIALIPLLLTPVFVYLLAEGLISFGGGEKDILLALPWLLWSVLFAISAFVLVFKKWELGKWMGRSALIASVGLVCFFIIAYVGSFLGIA